MGFSNSCILPLTAIVLIGSATLAQACSPISSVKHTFYGFPDNSPPGPATAFNCGGRNNVAGGSGTFSDPLTMATAPGEFNECETVYVPYLKKYVRVEDTCEQCTTDWNNGAGFHHIDIWTGSNSASGGQNQIGCEDQLTPPGNGQHTIIRFPASNLQVDSTDLYDPASQSCRTSHVYQNFNVGDFCASPRKDELR